MKFYHGTSSNAEIVDKILPPDLHNFGINEKGRTKHSQKVFFTTYEGYAKKYAKTCCKRVVGFPVVYEVVVDNPQHMITANGCDIYFDKEATVLASFKVEESSTKRRKKRKAIKNKLIGRT